MINSKKRQYKYGSCIPESKKAYRYLKKEGENPFMIEGYVKIDNTNDILPNVYFLARFFPNEVKKLGNINYNDYPKVIDHTWVEAKGIIIDRTINQFDKYGGVLEYYETDRYKLKKVKK